jgi:hypothetical protein
MRSGNFYCLSKDICITISVLWTRFDILMSSLKNSVHLLAQNIHDCGHEIFQFDPILSQINPMAFFPSYVLIRFRIVLSCARESSRWSHLYSFSDYFFFKFPLTWCRSWDLSFRPFPWPGESIHVVSLYLYAFPLSSHVLTKLQANFLLLVLPTKISSVFYLSPQVPQARTFHCTWFDLPYPSSFITRACHTTGSCMYLRAMPFVQ